MAHPASSRLVPAIIGCALFMQTLDATIVANAIPTMAQAMGESPLRMNLTISAYLLSVAVFLPLSAWVADRYGARRVFVAAIALFAFSSWLCALAQDLPQLIAARVLQGMAGATLTPVGRLVLLKTLPKSELVGAMAILTMPALIGPIVGPPLGGFIVTYSAWQWIFYINIPIGILGAVLVLRYVPDVREQDGRALDVRGFLWLAAGLGLLLFGLENVGHAMVQPLWASVVLTAGAGCLWRYVRHARRLTQPIIDLKLFALPSFAASVYGGAFARLIIGAGPFLLALLFQIGFGLTAFQAGLLTLTSAVGALLMKTAAPPILRAFGFRRVLIINTVLTSLVLLAQATFRPDTPYLLIVLVLFSGGFLRSLQFTSLGTMAFADVPSDQMSRASSLTSMGAQLSQAMGVAVAATALHWLVRIDGAQQVSAAHVGWVFGIIGVLSLCALFFFVRLPGDVASGLMKKEPTT